MSITVEGRGIAKGKGSGRLLISSEPISFLSGVDPETGIVLEENHPLQGISIDGRVLAFPYGKGSTVGSYVMYALKKNGRAPAAIINSEAEPIIATGAIIAGIPMIDRPKTPISSLKNDVMATVDGDEGTIIYEGVIED